MDALPSRVMHKEFPLISLPSAPLPPDPSLRFCATGQRESHGDRRAQPEAQVARRLDGCLHRRPERAREAVRHRFQAELVAVRRLLQKARCERPPAKRSKKASPPSVTVIKAPNKKMTLGEREMVAADLAGLAAQLPDDIVEFLEKQSCGNGGGEMEIDIHALQDEVAVELQQKLDKFARQRAIPSVQERMVAGEEDEEDVDILGGVSPLEIVQAPLKLAEEEEEDDVDICGDASPVVLQKKLGDDESISRSPSSSCDSDSDTGSDSDSDSDSSRDSSSSDSESEDDESVDSPAPAERAATPPRKEKQRKEARCRAREMTRQEVLETERTAMTDDTVHWTILKSLRIVEYNMARPDSLLRQLGLFLKDDDDQEQLHRNPEEDLEEGEIRF